MTAVNKDELRESVAQICKLHGVQEANYWDIADQVVTVFTAQLTSLIERVETAIPLPDTEMEGAGESNDHDIIHAIGFEKGFNSALEEVKRVLATIKHELIEGSNK